MNFSIDEISVTLNDQNGTPLANILNSLSLVKSMLGKDSWVGFYLYSKDRKKLLLGPFQGTEACLSIEPNKGVVGACFSSKGEIYVPDVNLLENYICCDPIAKSEFVYPLFDEIGEVYAVFDVDSPEIDGLKDFLPFLREFAEAAKATHHLEKLHF